MQPDKKGIEALVFDAYGTIFDTHSVFATCEHVFPGKGEAISTLWRAKQLEYSWQRSLMQRYAGFWQVTEEALRYTCNFLRLNAQPGQIELLMQAYLSLRPFPDVPPALEKLAQTGRKLAILSNGSPNMLNPVVENAGLQGLFEAVISVDEARRYKPDPAVYGLAPARLGIAPERIGFVSSNGWDAAGAKAFGFRVFWINRAGTPVEELPAVPDYIIKGAEELASLSSGW